MSNPDFPGPYWQDKPEPIDGRGAYGANGDDYGDGRYAAGNGRPAAGNGRSAGGYGGADNGRGRSRDGYGRSGEGRPGGAGGRRGRRGQRGYPGQDYPGQGYPGQGQGDRVAGGRSRPGYVSSDYSGGNNNGGDDRNGYPRNRYGTSGYGAGGDAGYGGGATGYADGDNAYGAGGTRRPAYGRGRGGYDDDGYDDGRTAYLGDTALADDGLGPLPGDDDWGPDGPGGHRGLRGLVDPDRRRLSAPGGPRQPGSWWRHWTWRKAAAVTGCMALGTVLIMIAGFFYVYNTVQLPLAALSRPFVQSTIVYFSDGKTEVGCVCTTNRTVLSAAKLGQDKYLEQAFFAAEDRHFLTEGGISLTGTARALLVDLTGSGYQGGSTITEQYVKTYFDQAGGNLTYKEKIKEVIDAIKLAKVEPKQWILAHYLNAIYLGSGANGVEAAAQTYFGKDAWQLDAPQSAMLAALAQEPSAFDPQTQPPGKSPSSLGYSLLDRWVIVLENMARDTLPNGQPVLTQQQLSKLVPDPHNPSAALKNFPKVVKLNSATASWSGYRGYIMTAVENELVQRYHFQRDQIGSAGLHIVTTFSKRKTAALYWAVHQARKMMQHYGQPLPWYAHVGVILENPKTGGIEASYGGPDFTAKQCQRLYCNLDMAMQSRNQVGSSFKPYVLAAAVKQGMNVATSKLNGYYPICVPPETMPTTFSKLWKPGTSCPTQWLRVKADPVAPPGPMSVKDAAALSSNPAFEDLTHRVGTGPIIKLAKRFGVDTSHAYSHAHPNGHGSGLVDDVGKIGIALGIAPLTVEEQATTFATLADDGVYHQPHVIAKITQNGNKIPVKVKWHRVLSHAQAADVDWALSFDTVYGTGVPNAQLSPPRPTIAKTGTTDVAQSAFFIGALPREFSLAVGMFTNKQDNLHGSQTLDILPSVGGTGGGYGGAWPATIWKLAMTRLLAMSHKPVAALSPLDLNGFQKWIQAKPLPKPKCKPSSGGGPGPPGHGHGKHAIIIGPPCISPSPSPSPTGFPSPSPSMSPSPTLTPSPSPSTTAGLPAQPAQAPTQKSATGTPSLTTAAMLPQPLSSKPGWAVTTTGLA